MQKKNHISFYFKHNIRKYLAATGTILKDIVCYYQNFEKVWLRIGDRLDEKIVTFLLEEH